MERSYSDHIGSWVHWSFRAMDLRRGNNLRLNSEMVLLLSEGFQCSLGDGRSSVLDRGMLPRKPPCHILVLILDPGLLPDS